MTAAREPWHSTGAVAVITGAGGLLGRGLALTCARAGMDIVVSDIAGEAAERVAAEGRGLGRKAVAVTTDVADPGAVEQLAEAAYATFGKVNLLCNNAGIALMKRYEDFSVDDWRRVLDINLMGVIHGIHSFLPRMKAQGGPRHIVNVSSMSGVGLASLRPMNAIYVTAKFAVVGLTETLAPILAEEGIGVSVLCPGMTVADPRQPMTYPMASAQWYRDNLLDAFQVAEETLRAIERNSLHVFPHRAGLEELNQRHALLMASYQQGADTRP